MRLHLLLQVIAGSIVGAQLGSAQAAPPLLSLTREARIGSTDGSTGELLAISAVTVGPDGNVFVFDSKAYQIKEYGPTGRFIRAIGRKGQGPGDFESVSTIGFLGDTLWASDERLGRVTLFDPTRQNPKAYPASYDPQLSGLVKHAPSGMLRSGFAVAQGELRLLRTRTAANFPSPIVLLRRDGTVADTIAAPVLRAAPDIVHLVSSTSAYGRRMTQTAEFLQPFPSDPFWRARPDGNGVVVVDGPPATTAGPATFTIQTFDASGRRAAVRSYAYLPIPITERLRDSVANAALVDAPPEVQRAYREQAVVPKHFPPVTDLVVGRDGTIWVQREKTNANPPTWNVIDSAGTMIGRAMIPKGVRVVYADRSQVLGVERDSDGIFSIARFRVGR
jgi:hypothetical protein